MVTGIINWQLDWSKLMEEQGQSLQDAKSLLEKEFRAITLKTLIERAPQKLSRRISSMIQVSAKDDYYVMDWEGQELYDTLALACESHRLRWIDGGHVTAFVKG